MAVVPMKKVLICGLKKDRKQILELLQRQGAVEITSGLEEDSIFRKTDVSSSKTVFERNAAVAEQALSVLAEYAPEKKGLLAGFEGRETLSLEEYESSAGKHDEIMKTAYRLQELEKEIAENKGMIPKLEQQIDALEPWKNFDLPLDYRGTRKTAAFIGSLAGDITLGKGHELLGQYAPQVESVDVTGIGGTAEQICLFIVCHRADAEAVEDALHKMNFSRPPLSHEVPAKKQKELEEQRKQNNVQLPPTGDGWLWPLPASNLKLTSAFGYRMHPVDHVPNSHTGIDVAASTGVPIYAARGGQVIMSEYGAGANWSYGNFVVIDHGDGTTTLYAHMSSRAVSEGELVTQGQTIGAVGDTGNVTGPHLHYEVRLNGQRTDPEACYPNLPFIRAYNW